MSKWTGLWRVQGHNKESNRVVVLKGDMEDEIHEKDYIENKITPPLEDLEGSKNR